MPGRGFLEVARELALGATEFHWRSAVVNAYYALFLECRDSLFDWGLRPARRDNIHAWVRLRLTYSTDADLKKIADVLDALVIRRNLASYDLNPLAIFADSAAAQDSIQKAGGALARLDQIKADPVRRASAVASIPP
jgi:hypothetical protein